MPGMIGGVGYDPSRWKKLLGEFQSVWGACDSFQSEHYFMAAHSFMDKPALHATNADCHFAIDGEIALYTHAANFVQHGKPNLFELNRDRMYLTAHAKGNIALVLPKDNILILATDDIGTFPLYFAETDHGVLFSSHLRPLARTVGAEVDPAGMIRYIQVGFINGGRTLFRDIGRLRPGQGLVFNPKLGELCTYESSRVRNPLLSSDNNEKLAARFWEALLNAVDRSLVAEHSHAIMSSGGWDSRLLVAAISSRSRKAPLVGYFHGHLKSRELEITKEILANCRIPIRIEGEDSEAYTERSLLPSFARTESVLFPNWLHAGTLLAAAGVQSVSAGVLGEVSGGHYGPAMMLTGWRQAVHVGSHLLHIDQSIPSWLGTDIEGFEGVLNSLLLRQLEKPWYIRQDYWEAFGNVLPQINADIESDLRRIAERGSQTADQLVEAFMTETRGCQWIGQQLLSCRSALDVANLYGDREVHEVASSIPYREKIYNKFTQTVLRKYAPLTLKASTAATLVPANQWIVIQEGTRIVRRLHDDAFLRLRAFSKGRFDGVHSGWLDFEFMRDGKLLHALADSLKSDFIDRKRVADFIDRIASYDYRDDLWRATQRFMRVMSTDLMFR
jgi:hypothetical protein